jgi:hypothetical protein
LVDSQRQLDAIYGFLSLLFLISAVYIQKVEYFEENHQKINQKETKNKGLASNTSKYTL